MVTTLYSKYMISASEMFAGANCAYEKKAVAIYKRVRVGSEKWFLKVSAIREFFMTG